MTHGTKFVIFTEFEGEDFKIELTPTETYYVIQCCRDINALFAYLRTIDRFEKIGVSGER